MNFISGPSAIEILYRCRYVVHLQTKVDVAYSNLVICTVMSRGLCHRCYAFTTFCFGSDCLTD